MSSRDQGAQPAPARRGHRLRMWLRAALIVSFIFTAAQATSAAEEEIAEGRAMAERLCAACHMNPSQGEKAGPSGIPSFRAVANRAAQTQDGVEAWLLSVPPMMPDHNLSQEEIRVLAAFIMSLREKR